MPPASDRPATPAFGVSTTRQGLPSGPVAVVRPSGPVEVETEPPGPELEEDELEAAMAPLAPTVSAPRAKAVRAILDRDMGSPSKTACATPKGRAKNAAYLFLPGAFSLLPGPDESWPGALDEEPPVPMEELESPPPAELPPVPVVDDEPEPEPEPADEPPVPTDELESPPPAEVPPVPSVEDEPEPLPEPDDEPPVPTDELESPPPADVPPVPSVEEEPEPLPPDDDPPVPTVELDSPPPAEVPPVPTVELDCANAGAERPASKVPASAIVRISLMFKIFLHLNEAGP